mmetsp:Transcript_50726/g.57471  ORF Transcript_50726/g.57471 Transcript_50726/m.57471 type:complete len:208 (+) Transcript_50726:586-1209(+)
MLKEGGINLLSRQQVCHEIRRYSLLTICPQLCYVLWTGIVRFHKVFTVIGDTQTHRPIPIRLLTEVSISTQHIVHCSIDRRWELLSRVLWVGGQEVSHLNPPIPFLYSQQLVRVATLLSHSRIITVRADECLSYRYDYFVCLWLLFLFLFDYWILFFWVDFIVCIIMVMSILFDDFLKHRSTGLNIDTDKFVLPINRNIQFICHLQE